VNACGLDLSGQLLAEAQRLDASLTFVQGDMLALPLADQALAGIATFYSIIHLRRDRLPDALREFSRVLKPGGWLLLAFHSGEGDLHLDEWFGKPASLDATFFLSSEVRECLMQAGFIAPQVREREPYSFEYASRRVYITTCTRPVS
jgi:ubiquinone/menaquinone biosynthesis C-methylase UbiE